ncbi:MAG: nucleoside transporter, partial [Candidatus Hydrogenedens sp.]|nr:nucleoside transporter [Candidatus Hydrogenedens sp.]
MSETPILKPTQALDLLYEFEREPVTEDKLQPGRYFAGLFAGEHVAGTEFVIGALFVSWGVNAYDIFVGLLLGNLMAVLTWTLICAPIAVRTRLTLYWFLRKVAGPTVTTIYNVLNAFLFCILAGCMITVSASAVRVPLGIPPQTQWIPTDFRFVLVVLVVG